MATEQVVIVTRQELYEKVWSTPLTQLGPTYGVTHVHLANICDDHDVPRPPRGYWQQKAFGKDSPKPSLPACDDPADENVRISPDAPRDAEPTPSPPVPTQPQPTVAALPGLKAQNPPPTDPGVPTPTKMPITSGGLPARAEPQTTGPVLVTLQRQELYDLVWSTPMSKLCQEYGISDVGLAKTCKRHQIPYPPRGYWAKVRSGCHTKQLALKPVSEEKLQEIQILKHPPQTADGSGRQEVVEAHAAERKEENRISVGEQLTDPHPLVDRTIRSLSSAKPGANGRVRPRAGRCLDVEVSPGLVDRAGRILDALVKALTARGYTVSVGDEEVPKTWVTVLEERMSLRLEEGLDREEKIDSFFSHRHEYSYAPNGKLTLRIDDIFGGNCRKQWSDSNATLENRLNTVVTGMVTAAKATRAVREANERREREWKEEARRREEREQRQRQQEARVQDFEQKLAAWERAERIRAFIAAVQARAIRRDGAIAPDGELDRWIAWALRRADRTDPVVTDRPERRWPPPESHRVKLPNQGYHWRPDESNGTLVLPPAPVNRSADGTTEASTAED